MRRVLLAASVLAVAGALFAPQRVRTTLALWVQEVLDATFERVEELKERDLESMQQARAA